MTERAALITAWHCQVIKNFRRISTGKQQRLLLFAPVSKTGFMSTGARSQVSGLLHPSLRLIYSARAPLLAEITTPVNITAAHSKQTPDQGEINATIIRRTELLLWRPHWYSQGCFTFCIRENVARIRFAIDNVVQSVTAIGFS